MAASLQGLAHQPLGYGVPGSHPWKQAWAVLQQAPKVDPRWAATKALGRTGTKGAKGGCLGLTTAPGTSRW